MIKLNNNVDETEIRTMCFTRKCDRDHRGSRLVSFSLLFNLCPKTHTHSKQQVMMTTASDSSTKKPHKQPFMINGALVAPAQYNAHLQAIQQLLM